MLLNRFFRLEMVKGTHNHDPRTLNAPFRAARHPGLQNNKTGSIHVWTPVVIIITLPTKTKQGLSNNRKIGVIWMAILLLIKFWNL